MKPKAAGQTLTISSEEIAVIEKGNTDVAVYDPGLALGDEAGLESIDKYEVVPFLALAQKTSKAIDPSETEKYIKGLTFGSMYNSGSQEIYGTAPISFIPVRVNERAHLKKEDGTLGEPVDFNDPRVTWDGARAAGREKPEGVQIIDWAALLVREDGSLEKIMISFQSTNFKTGKNLCTAVKRFRDKARMAGKGFRSYQLIFSVGAVLKQAGQNKWAQFVLKHEGFTTAGEFGVANEWFEASKDRAITTAEHEPEAAEAEVVEAQIADDAIPF